ncbi:hypothetical protein B0H19DRAFT_1378873 [Mycena capillaripes]|nr:hypothetical protein B0H19DRAFT_1378873 [Mycena capillaripes]
MLNYNPSTWSDVSIHVSFAPIIDQTSRGQDTLLSRPQLCRNQPRHDSAATNLSIHDAFVPRTSPSPPPTPPTHLLFSSQRSRSEFSAASLSSGTPAFPPSSSAFRRPTHLTNTVHFQRLHDAGALL